MGEETKLFQRIKKEIDNIPVIDLHTHLKLDLPNAKNLAEILFYHLAGFEIVSAGGEVRDELPNFSSPVAPVDNGVAEKTVSKYLPYLEFIKNTSTYYSLNRIFNDLYHFDFQNINSSNWRILYDKILKTGNDDNWTREVLLEKAKIESSITGLWWWVKKEPKGKWSETKLILPNLEMTFWGIISDMKEDILSGKSLDESVSRFMEKYLSGGISSFIFCDFPFVGFCYQEIFSHNKVEDLAKKYLSEKPLSEEENRKLFYALLRKTLEICNDKEIPWIMSVGTEGLLPRTVQSVKLLPSGIRISHDIFPEMAQVFYHYPKIKFLVLLTSFALSQDLCIIAKQFPNVYPLAFQWHGFYPAFIEQMMEQRLDILPYNRPIGFISDAYCVEWSYGKLSLVKRVLTRVLTRRIEEGIYSEELALKIARRWLYDNPKEIYFGYEK